MAVRRKNFVSEAVVLQAQSREKTTAAAGEGCSAEDKSCGEFSRLFQKNVSISFFNLLNIQR